MCANQYEDGFECDPNATLLATQSEAGGKPMDGAPIFDVINVKGVVRTCGQDDSNDL